MKNAMQRKERYSVNDDANYARACAYQKIDAQGGQSDAGMDNQRAGQVIESQSAEIMDHNRCTDQASREKELRYPDTETPRVCKNSGNCKCPDKGKEYR